MFWSCIQIKKNEWFNWKVRSCRPSFKLRDWLNSWLVCWISSCLEAQCLVAGIYLHMSGGWPRAPDWISASAKLMRNSNAISPRFGWTWSFYGFAAGMPALGGDFNRIILIQLIGPEILNVTPDKIQRQGRNHAQSENPQCLATRNFVTVPQNRDQLGLALSQPLVSAMQQLLLPKDGTLVRTFWRNQTLPTIILY